MLTRIERFIENGRVFIARGRDVQDVVSFLTDADLEHEVVDASAGGWWVEAA